MSKKPKSSKTKKKREKAMPSMTIVYSNSNTSTCRAIKNLVTTYTILINQPKKHFVNMNKETDDNT